MEAYVSALNYAIPFFVALILIERIAAGMKGAAVIRSMDTLSSLSSGLTNVIKDVLGLTVIILSYGWMVEHMALINIEATWLVYVLAFLGLDFAGYWVHRISHRVNYFWNHHIIHHSSEEYNLGCALRQTISAWFSITFVFLVPIALLGVPAEVVAIVAPLHLFAQYWYHTRLIGKLGFLEKIIVTPSHHRVHHAINEEYLDKNLAQIFIFWDKLFGTFQEELDDVPAVYGVKRPIRSWNPFIINFIHLWQLIKDAWRANSWWDKLRIWFMPTGWRPSDVVEKYPLDTISDVYAYQKYDPKLSNGLQFWSWTQFVFTFFSMMYLFNHLNAMTFLEMLAYGAFLYLSIFGFTMLMDKSKFAWVVEILKSGIGMGIILYFGDWFYINEWISGGSLLMMSYYLLSALIVVYFHWTEIRVEDEALQTAA
jgi:sterol desaturase/sphingolipid hydroxylase (fatty acid hydroxylase superfamily)